MQRINQTRCANHRCPVLVVVKDRDIHLFLQTLLNDETLGRLDVFKVHTTKRRTHQLHSIHECIHVLGIQLNVDAVYIRKPLKQYRFPFHHWLTCQRTQIPKAQNR